MTPWPKINRVPPLIIHNLQVKSESDWAITVICIMSTKSYTKSANVDIDLWLRDLKSIWFLLWSSTTCMWSLKVIGLNICSRYCVHKVLYTECQSWLWPLIPWPKIKSVPPLIIHNLHVKFESAWSKTVVAIVSTRLSVTDPPTRPRTHSLTHPSTHERPRYYILSNAVARG